MNTKRQTIWLVSMLSLMVVLSAYYLFTEDPGKKDLATGTTNTQDIKVGIKETTPNASGTAKTTDTKTGDDKAASSKSVDAKTDASKTGTTGTTGTTGNTKTDATKTDATKTGTVKTDEQVIQQLQTQGKSGHDYIIAQQMERNQNFTKQLETLITTMTDTKKSNDEVSKATNQYNDLEQKVSKLENIEETLGQNYDGVVVTQDNDKWKVVVQADKLEKSEGASIATLVMSELNVGPEKVVIQRIGK